MKAKHLQAAMLASIDGQLASASNERASYMLQSFSDRELQKIREFIASFPTKRSRYL